MRCSVAAVAFAWLPLTCLAGYGDLTRGSVAAAALAWLPPACLAGYGGDVRGRVAAAALEWLPPAFLAKYGDTTDEKHATVGLIVWFWECVWSLALGRYGWNSQTRASRGICMVVGPILASAASNRGAMRLCYS